MLLSNDRTSQETLQFICKATFWILDFGYPGLEIDPSMVMIRPVGIVSRLNFHQAGLKVTCQEKPEVIIWDTGILTKNLANKGGKLIDNGLIILYTDLIPGNFRRRQLLAPSNFGKITFIKRRMNGIR